MTETVEVVNKTTGEVEHWSLDKWTAERDRLLVEWKDAKAALDVAKELEMKLRKDSVDFISNPNIKSGTERVELGNGYEAKMVKKISYGWAKTAEGKLNKPAIDAALSAIEKMGPAEALMADRLVKWEPTLSLTEYKLIPPNVKAIIDDVIRTTDGAPTLEIIEPKVKK